MHKKSRGASFLSATDVPIDYYVKDDHVEDIAAMVEDALSGHPS
jgi:hypothetical protein